MWCLFLLACGGPDRPTPSIFDRDADGVLAPIDCDDDNAGVYPGANEVYYDGRDANCDGADDYDQDGDGYRWTAHGGQDCDDTDPLVNPDGVEVPYDGADNDCDPSTPEDDLDGDGVLIFEDCDDADPATYPGATERLADGIDQDCRGDGDGAVLGRWTELLDAPRHLRSATLDGRPVLAFVTERIDPPDPYDPGTDPGPDPTAEPYLQVAVALVDPTSPAPDLLVAHGVENVSSSTADVPTSVDVVGDGDTLWVGVGIRTALSGSVRARLSPFVPFNDSFVRQNGPVRTLDDATGDLLRLDVQLEADGARLSAGGADALLSLRGDIGLGEGLGGTAVSDGTGGTAVAPTGELWACTSGQRCEAWALPADGPPTDPVSLPSITRVIREHDGLLVVQEGPTGAIVEGLGIPLEVFGGEVVVDADAVRVTRANGTDWVVAAAVVEGSGDDSVVLAYGPVDTALLTTSYYAGPDNSFPLEVAVWADKERVVVGALTQDFGRYDRLWLGEFPWD